jgi:hypothetical protein
LTSSTISPDLNTIDHTSHTTHHDHHITTLLTMPVLNRLLLTGLALFSPAAATNPAVVCPGGANTIDLYSAGAYVILAKAGVTNTGSSTITGDIGVSPIALTAVTGFDLTLYDATKVGADDDMNLDGKFSDSVLVKGRVYAADFGGSVATELTTAVGAMGTAYTTAAGCTVTTPDFDADNADGHKGGGLVGTGADAFPEVAGTYENLNGGAAFLGPAGDCPVGGFTLYPGVYTWNTAITVGAGSSITLKGTDTDVFVLKTSGGINLGAGSKVVLSGGVKAENVFWQVAGALTVGAGAIAEGVFLVGTAASVGAGASLNGRILAQTAVSLTSATITETP